MSSYGRLTRADLVLAYELRSEGIEWQHIASGLGVDTDYLRQRIRQAEINGLHAPRLPQ
ncbi:hypothetical protein D3C78_1231040 [compost metagenome]